MDETKSGEFVFGDVYERRVWVAAFEAECRAECSQLAAMNADARLSLFRAMSPMAYANAGPAGESKTDPLACIRYDEPATEVAT